MTECTPCPNGSYTSEEGATTCDHSTCAPGHMQSISPQIRCIPCGQNQYQPLAGQNACLHCPHSVRGRGHTQCIKRTATSGVQECSHTTCTVVNGKLEVQHTGTKTYNQDMEIVGNDNYANGMHHKCQYSKEADKCSCVCWNPTIAL